MVWKTTSGLQVLSIKIFPTVIKNQKGEFSSKILLKAPQTNTREGFYLTRIIIDSFELTNLSYSRNEYTSKIYSFLSRMS